MMLPNIIFCKKQNVIVEVNLNEPKIIIGIGINANVAITVKYIKMFHL